MGAIGALSTRGSTILIVCCLTILVGAIYAPVRSFEFINFDDNVYITQNPEVLQGITWHSVQWAFSTTLGGHWHPLTWIAHALDVTLFGLNPSGHHLVNVLLHLVNTILVFLLFREASMLSAFFGAVLFSVHPMRLESVAWVAERKDVLSACFSLSTCWMYCRFVRTGSVGWYRTSIATFIAALLAKPTAVTVPVFLMLLDIWPLQHRAQTPHENDHLLPVTRLFRHKAPFAFLAGAMAVVTILAQQSGGGLRTFAEVPWSERIGGVAPSAMAYIGKLFWPSGLSIFYPRMQYPPGLESGAIIGLLSASWLCWQCRQRAPYVLVAWLWFLVAIVPISGIVPVGGQCFADRWTYLAHIVPIIALVHGSFEVATTTRLRTGLVVGWSMMAVIFAIITTYHLPQWRSSKAVFSHSLDVTPFNFMAHTNLGVALLDEGRINDAAHHFEEAVRLNPTYPEAQNNLGLIRANQGRFSEAIIAFQRAIEIRPAFDTARRNLMQAHLDMRQLDRQVRP